MHISPKISIFGLILSYILVLGTSCSNTSYSNQLKNEKKTIDDFIKRNNINIIYEEPDYDKWGEKDYLQVGDYCYFHLSVMGDTLTEEVNTKDDVNIRYRKYTLTLDPDTISYWNTNELPTPIEFQFNVSSTNACTAWHYAIAKMKYTGSEGTVICPSKLGFQTDASSVTPYGYDLKLQIRRF